MIFIKQTFIFLLTLVLVLQISCVPISDYKEVLGYLQNFGYLSSDEKTSLNQIIDNHESVKNDKRLKRALKYLQRNGNIPITGKFDKNTASLMEAPRCGVSDKILNIKRYKRYSLLHSKWHTTNITYRFDHDNKKPFVDEEDNIRRIIREAFNVWETDTIMKFTEAKEGDADILISFVHPTHTNLDPFVFGPSTLAHAFQPGTELGGDAHFNEEVDWDFNVKYDSKPEGDKVSFFGVALHELGHSLGLGHTRDSEAVMYEFYSRSTATLAEDDIRGIQHIYGVPPNRKFKPRPTQDNSEEEMPVWGQSPIQTHGTDKCNTSYDAIAMIDDELIAFSRKYMFGPNLDLTESRVRWKDLPSTLTHVDAVFQTSDKLVLFFINQDVYTFKGNKLVKSYKLRDFGFYTSILKIDAIFRKSDNRNTYIFSGDRYYKFDEHKLMIRGFVQGYEIEKVFIDVYDIDTGFTYKDGKTYFFKNQSYFEFNNKLMSLDRMNPEYSGNFFMNCNRMIISERAGFSSDIVDYIDKFIVVDESPDCNNPEIVCEKDSANSIKSCSFIAVILIITHYFI